MSNDDLVEYEVPGAIPYTIQVTSDEAKALNDAAKPAEKPVDESEPSTERVHTTGGAKAATAANKRHTPSNK